jgi:hypothetical protein
MNSRTQKPKLAMAALAGGLTLTFVLTVSAFVGNTRAWGCTFAWQACLVQNVIHTPNNPNHEATPLDLFAFILGVALGVPIYSLLSYLLLAWWEKFTGNTPQQS